MEEVSPTRTELLQKKLQIALADQGKDLLKEKRDALLIEFMAVMDSVLRSSRELEKIAAEAHYALTMAKAVDGLITVKSASFATRGEILVDIKGSYIMGVPIPEIGKKSVTRSLMGRGYSLAGVSSRIDEAAEKFERQLDTIIQIASIETRLRRLGEEIQKTRRRVNALEHIVIPALREQLKYIQMTLEERAREDLFRLKKVKKALEQKKEAAISSS